MRDFFPKTSIFSLFSHIYLQAADEMGWFKKEDKTQKNSRWHVIVKQPHFITENNIANLGISFCLKMCFSSRKYVIHV